MERRELTKRILVQGAMDSETDLIADSLTDKRSEIIDGFRFVSGTYRGIPVTVSRTQIGKINAAVATYIGIKKFEPSLVINQGTAGAHNIDLNVGDILVGKKLISHEAYVSERRGRGEGYSIRGRELISERFAGGEWIKSKDICPDEELIRVALTVPNPHGRVVSGTIATGDGFNREQDAITEMHEHNESDCEEMETFVAAQVSAHLGVPFLGFRVISNSELKGLYFDETTGSISQEFCLRLLERL